MDFIKNVFAAYKKDLMVYEHAQTENERMEKVIHTNRRQVWAGVAFIISEKNRIEVKEC